MHSHLGRMALVATLLGCSHEESAPVDTIGDGATESGDGSTETSMSTTTKCCPVEGPNCYGCAYAGGVDRGTGCYEYCNVNGEGSQLVYEDGCAKVKLGKNTSCSMPDASPDLDGAPD